MAFPQHNPVKKKKKKFETILTYKMCLACDRLAVSGLLIIEASKMLQNIKEVI